VESCESIIINEPVLLEKMKIVEVFKTNVSEDEQAKLLIGKLLADFPDYRINFDLEDCDKILRVEAGLIEAERIIHLVKINGYHCELLP
jgi:hypothetical protein